MAAVGGPQTKSRRLLFRVPAGRVFLRGNYLYADCHEGWLCLHEDGEGNVEHCWEDKQTGRDEDVFLIEKGSAEFKSIEKYLSHRVYILTLKNSGLKYHYWMQHPDLEKDKTNCMMVNDILNYKHKIPSNHETTRSAKSTSSIRSKATNAVKQSTVRRRRRVPLIRRLLLGELVNTGLIKPALIGVPKKPVSSRPADSESDSEESSESDESSSSSKDSDIEQPVTAASTQSEVANSQSTVDGDQETHVRTLVMNELATTTPVKQDDTGAFTAVRKDLSTAENNETHDTGGSSNEKQKDDHETTRSKISNTAVRENETRQREHCCFSVPVETTGLNYLSPARRYSDSIMDICVHGEFDDAKKDKASSETERQNVLHQHSIEEQNRCKAETVVTMHKEHIKKSDSKSSETSSSTPSSRYGVDMAKPSTPVQSDTDSVVRPQEHYMDDNSNKRAMVENRELVTRSTSSSGESESLRMKKTIMAMQDEQVKSDNEDSNTSSSTPSTSKSSPVQSDSDGTERSREHCTDVSLEKESVLKNKELGSESTSSSGESEVSFIETTIVEKEDEHVKSDGEDSKQSTPTSSSKSEKTTRSSVAVQTDLDKKPPEEGSKKQTVTKNKQIISRSTSPTEDSQSLRTERSIAIVQKEKARADKGDYSERSRYRSPSIKSEEKTKSSKAVQTNLERNANLQEHRMEESHKKEVIVITDKEVASRSSVNSQTRYSKNSYAEAEKAILRDLKLGMEAREKRGLMVENNRTSVAANSPKPRSEGRKARTKTETEKQNSAVVKKEKAAIKRRKRAVSKPKSKRRRQRVKKQTKPDTVPISLGTTENTSTSGTSADSDTEWPAKSEEEHEKGEGTFDKLKRWLRIKKWRKKVATDKVVRLSETSVESDSPDKKKRKASMTRAAKEKKQQKRMMRMAVKRESKEAAVDSTGPPAKDDYLVKMKKWKAAWHRFWTKEVNETPRGSESPKPTRKRKKDTPKKPGKKADKRVASRRAKRQKSAKSKKEDKVVKSDFSITRSGQREAPQAVLMLKAQNPATRASQTIASVGLTDAYLFGRPEDQWSVQGRSNESREKNVGGSESPAQMNSLQRKILHLTIELQQNVPTDHVPSGPANAELQNVAIFREDKSTQTESKSEEKAVLGEHVKTVKSTSSQTSG